MNRFGRTACVVCVLVFLSELHSSAQDALSNTRLPVPSMQLRNEKRKEVIEIFEIGNAISISAKQALAKKLLETANGTNDDPAAKFVLMNLSREIAQQTGDIVSSFAAIDSIANDFQFDEQALRIATLRSCAAFARRQDTRRTILDAGKRLIDAATKEEDFKSASAIAKAMASICRTFGQPKLVNEYKSKVLQLEADAKADTEYKKALRVLKFDPDHSAANEAVGNFLAFQKSDWETALPHWHKSGRSQLASIAQMEMDADTAPKRATLAEGWQRLADSWKDETQQKQMLARSAFFFQSAVNDLQGLERVKVEKKLRLLADRGVVAMAQANANRSNSGTLIIDGQPILRSKAPLLNDGISDMRWASKEETFDLLPAVSLSRDQIYGSWARKGTSVVSSSASHSRVRLPVIPPPEYDFDLDFSTDGNSSVVVTLTSPTGSRFSILLDGVHQSVSGINLVDGVRISEPQPTRKLGKLLAPNASNSLSVSVRKSGILVGVNGSKISEFKGDFSRLSSEDQWEGPDRSAIIVGCSECRVTFDSATLRTRSAGRQRDVPWPEKRKAQSSWYRRQVGRPPARLTQRRQAYLDDFPETSFHVGYGILGKHGASAVFAKDRVIVNQKAYGHALQCHPRENGNARVTYRLGEKYAKFTTFIAIMDFKDKPVGARIDGSLTFQIWGDGKLLAEQQGMQTTGVPQRISADLTGVDSLTLLVKCSGRSSAAWATWLDPILHQ